jgi:hypothetical protein
MENDLYFILDNVFKDIKNNLRFIYNSMSDKETLLDISTFNIELIHDDIKSLIKLSKIVTYKHANFFQLMNILKKYGIDILETNKDILKLMKINMITKDYTSSFFERETYEHTYTYYLDLNSVLDEIIFKYSTSLMKTKV